MKELEKQYPEPKPEPADISRRDFLCIGAALALLGVAGCAGGKDEGGNIPSTQGTASPVPQPLVAQKIGESKYKVAGGGKLQNGQAIVFSLPGSSNPGVVLRDSKGDLRAMSALCTHAGCTVAWQQPKQTLHCPCHNSNFDANGKVLSGPAKEPLVQWKVAVQGEDAVVSL